MFNFSDPSIQWAYILGCIGILLEWKAYTVHCGRAFRVWTGLGALFWAGMYWGLGAWTSSLTMGTTGIRSLWSMENGRYRHLSALFFVALFSGLTVQSWQGLVSLLPAFAVINTTLALFYLGNRSMRIVLLASSAAWITNDVLWLAWPALLAESVAALLNLRTIRQLKKIPKAQ